MNRAGRHWCRYPARLVARRHGTLRSWVKRTEIDTGRRDGVTSDDEDRLKALARENRELKRANEILKTASAFFARAELDRRLK